MSAVVVAAAAALLSSHDAVACSVPAGYDWRASDPIEYADLVVEGTIDKTEISGINGSLIDPKFARSNAIMVVHLSDMRVLRGPPPTAPLYGGFDIDWRAWRGRHVVLCGYWNKKLGRYRIGSRESALWSHGAAWLREVPTADVDTLSNDALRSRLAAVQPDAIIRRSDVVVSGTVAAVEDSVVQTEGLPRGFIRAVSLHPCDVVRGGPASTIRFRAYSWEAEFAWPKVGERWVGFLERRGNGLWVISGRNGFLRIGDSGSLLYNGQAPYPLTEQQVMKMVRPTGTQNH